MCLILRNLTNPEIWPTLPPVLQKSHTTFLQNNLYYYIILHFTKNRSNSSIKKRYSVEVLGCGTRSIVWNKQIKAANTVASTLTFSIVWTYLFFKNRASFFLYFFLDWNHKSSHYKHNNCSVKKSILIIAMNKFG